MGAGQSRSRRLQDPSAMGQVKGWSAPPMRPRRMPTSELLAARTRRYEANPTRAPNTTRRATNSISPTSLNPPLKPFPYTKPANNLYKKVNKPLKYMSNNVAAKMLANLKATGATPKAASMPARLQNLLETPVPVKPKLPNQGLTNIFATQTVASAPVAAAFPTVPPPKKGLNNIDWTTNFIGTPPRAASAPAKNPFNDWEPTNTVKRNASAAVAAPAPITNPFNNWEPTNTMKRSASAAAPAPITNPFDNWEPTNTVKRNAPAPIIPLPVPTTLETIIPSPPTTVNEPYRNNGNIGNAMGPTEQQIAAYKAANPSRPTVVNEPYRNNGNIGNAMGPTEEQIAAYKAANPSRPTVVNEPYSNIGNIGNAMGPTEEQIAAYKAANNNAFGEFMSAPPPTANQAPSQPRRRANGLTTKEYKEKHAHEKHVQWLADRAAKRALAKASAPVIPPSPVAISTNEPYRNNGNIGNAMGPTAEQIAAYKAANPQPTNEPYRNNGNSGNVFGPSANNIARANQEKKLLAEAQRKQANAELRAARQAALFRNTRVPFASLVGANQLQGGKTRRKSQKKSKTRRSR